MVRLQRSELPHETLRAGDLIQYYSRALVAGDARGYRKSRVLRIAQFNDVNYPIRVDTGEILELSHMMRRVANISGIPFEVAVWRKMRTYELVDGSVDLPTRSTILKSAIRQAVDDASAAVAQQLRVEREAADTHAAANFAGRVSEAARDVSVSSTSELRFQPPATSGGERTDVSEGPASEEKVSGQVPMEILLQLAAPDSDSESLESVMNTTSTPSTTTVGVEPSINTLPVSSHPGTSAESEDSSPDSTQPSESPDEVLDPQQYLAAIPTRLERNKIRHQAKKRSNQWHVPRSRKRKHMARSAITRSGANVYHSRNVTAKKMKDFLKLPFVRERLKALHVLRPSYTTQKDTAEVSLAPAVTVKWPNGVDEINECRIPEGLQFPHVGDFDPCSCVGDCFFDTCENAQSSIYCTSKCCRLDALCSNAPRNRATLKLFETARVGLGVYTTAFLDVGDILGEYVGQLRAHEAQIEGQPEVAKKYNSGYTMLYYTKSTTKKYVYIEAGKCGSMMRFLSHSCVPNADFIEMRNGRNVKILVVMKKAVKAGTEITVNYGDEVWFKCACDECWQEE